MEYRIVVADCTDSLKEEVNRLINDGWIPQGGVCSFGEGYFCQAMIKN